MKWRLYPAFVTMLGGVGLGMALTYFAGVVMIFLPGMEDWALFFTNWALLLVLPPYLALVAHMVLRNHVGRSLLKAGSFEEAIRYGKRRSKKSLLRSKREVANQVMVWARGLVGLGKYEEAEELLRSRGGGLVGAYAVEAARWRVELALRFDDRERAETVLEAIKGKNLKAKGPQFAAMKAVEAELALRDGDEERYRECAMAALWASPGDRRAQLSQALAMAHFGYHDDEALERLEASREFAIREIPARASELKALEAKMAWRAGAVEDARALLEEARQEPADHWSEAVIKSVEESLARGEEVHQVS